MKSSRHVARCGRNWTNILACHASSNNIGGHSIADIRTMYIVCYCKRISDSQYRWRWRCCRNNWCRCCRKKNALFYKP